MAGEHPIQGLMKTTMESIREMVDVNTIVGEPVETVDGSVIVPVSRVSFGFAAGGGEYGAGGGGVRKGDREGGGSESGLAFGGGSGAGVTIQPVGFLVVGHDSVRMLPVDGRAVVDRLIDAVPTALNELRNLFTGGLGEALGRGGGHGGHGGHGHNHGGQGCGGEQRSEGEGRGDRQRAMWRGHRHGGHEGHEGDESCDCGKEHASDQQGALTSRQEQPEDR